MTTNNTTVDGNTPLGTRVMDEFGAVGYLVSRSSRTNVLVGKSWDSPRSECIAYAYTELKIAPVSNR